jgi:hypothetical protein
LDNKSAYSEIQINSDLQEQLKQTRVKRKTGQFREEVKKEKEEESNQNNNDDYY